MMHLPDVPGTITETRIFYRYGVNSGWYSGRGTAAQLQHRYEQESMGEIKVEQVQTRTITMGEWVDA